MYITATILFIIGMAMGAVYGYFYLQTTLERFFSFIAGGFFGSCAGAICFIYLYFSSGSNDLDEESDKKTYHTTPISPEPVALETEKANNLPTLACNGNGVEQPQSNIKLPEALKKEESNIRGESNIKNGLFAKTKDLFDPKQQK
ncbi:exported hypothetical protein [Desulfamplus magnetovallimortis]|uniref:Uncharacterized protein n=1 Tax=Desulfamplus magnetovallimortis TaxID=1246637 RepID=A0A1W1H629_9BACT|nr:hypothetical protein [Desulfamplus magnetovallimortis]SLM27923.1 exported hypothetical protein [Desulfamplus magnetovallimortis]